MTDEQVRKPRLIVLASTYPRWEDDHEPSFVHQLARRLTSWFDVVVVCPHAAGAARREVMDGVQVERYRYAPGSLETLVNDGGITTNLRRAPWKWLLVPTFILGQWMTARRLVTANAIVHAHWILTPGLVARCLKAPFVVTSHGADLFALRGRVPTAIKRWVLRHSSDLTVVSRAMLPLAQALCGGRPAAVAPMGVDLQHVFTPDERVTRESSRLLFVGRLVEKKGLDVLLHALPIVLNVRPEVSLTVVGFGPLEEVLRAQCTRLGLDGVVTFAGAMPSSSLVKYYRSATAFVAPFRKASSGDQEGLGLVLVEALGCGCPVVASDLPAVRDVLADMPGVLCVPEADAAALASGILQVLNSNAAAEVGQGRERLVARFDWDAVANRYADILSSVRRNTADGSR
ncbi:glycosyltransferase [Luteibacter sp. UNCMF366Tsu5.1]|uniref:glycosyltransferase n=1 Tax=Luteibacter sp. UNCMF366Tsu5.1 TaxID=1502758 RepID=UPI000909116E|nr:glycosyltransferase [Luteibacter sp. UNCMF366Tsu5.1]SFW61467.1 Glycosyltransferase involved in cell wall bisynthesis [Luteibacter sp. UNCMF366Tsu5.1]